MLKARTSLMTAAGIALALAVGPVVPAQAADPTMTVEELFDAPILDETVKFRFYDSDTYSRKREVTSKVTAVSAPPAGAADDTVVGTSVTFNSIGVHALTFTAPGYTAVTQNVQVYPGLTATYTVSGANDAIIGSSSWYQSRGFDRQGNPTGDTSSYSIASNGSGDTVAGWIVTFGSVGARTVSASVDGRVVATTVVTVSPGVLTPGAVQIVGDPTVGSRLKAETAGWMPEGVALQYQWMRGAGAIAGGTKPSYKLSADDRGFSVSVEVASVKKGYASGEATSASTNAVKGAAKLRLLLPAKLVAGKKNTVTIVLIAAPATKTVGKPKGSVRVYVGSKHVTVKIGARSTVTVTIPKVRKGKTVISATYLGSATYATVSTKPVNRKAR